MTNNLDSFVSEIFIKYAENLFSQNKADLKHGIFFYNKQILINIVAPLYGFGTHVNLWDFESLRLDDDLFIRKITEEERESLLKSMDFNRLTMKDFG